MNEHPTEFRNVRLLAGPIHAGFPSPADDWRGEETGRQRSGCSVLLNLPKYGHAIFSIKFLLQRGQVHLLLPMSQSFPLRKRFISR